MRKDSIVDNPYDSMGGIKHMMLNTRYEFMPVVDENGLLVNGYFREDLFSKKPEPTSHFDFPVMILAGGFGSHFKPLPLLFISR